MRVSYTDGQGTAEAVTSAQTGAVANVNDVPSGVPTIAGTATEDQTLTAVTAGISDADGLGAFSYQWLRDGVAVGGATASTYLLGDTDVGTQLSVRVNYIDGQGTAETLTSAQTNAVANVNDAPVGLPTIGGTASEDQTLTAVTASIADADGVGVFGYQWLRNGVAVGGATASTYLLGDADVGAQLSVRVSYTDGQGSAETLTSAPTSPVVNVNDAPVLQTNQPLTVIEGGSAGIDASLLLSTDVDNTASQLTYSVTSAAAFGRLESTAAPGTALNQFTQADVNAGQVRYVHDGSETLADTFTFVVSDSNGAALGSVAFRIVVTPQDDAPTLGSSSTAANTSIPGGAPQTIDAGIRVADADSAQLVQAVVRIANHYMQGFDQLVLTGSHPVSALWNPLDGSLTLSGAASPEAYAAALSSVQFASTSTLSGTRDVSFVVSDGALPSALLVKTLAVAGVVATPSRTGEIPGPAPVRAVPSIELAAPSAAASALDAQSETIQARAANERPAAAPVVAVESGPVASLGPTAAVARADQNLQAPQRRSSNAGESGVHSGADISALIESVLRRAQSGLISIDLAPPPSSDGAADLAPGADAEPDATGLAFARSKTASWRGLLDEQRGQAEPSPAEFNFDLLADPGVAGGLLLSASVLWWASRAGGLLAAMMASVPAWRSFDPLPILVRERSNQRGALARDAAGGAWMNEVQPAPDNNASAAAQRTMLEELAGQQT